MPLLGLVLLLTLATATVVTPAAAAPLPTLPVGSNPTDMVLTPNGATLLVTNRDDDTLTFIDTASWTVVKTLAVGNEPGALAVTPDGTKAYVATTDVADSHGVVKVVSLSSRTVIGTVGTNGIPESIAFTGNSAKAYIVSGSSLNVIDVATGNFIRYIDVQYDANVAIASNDGRHIFIGHGDNGGGPIYRIDSATDTIVGDAGNTGLGVIFAETPDRTTMVVPGSNEVYVENAYRPPAVQISNVGAMVAITPVGSQAYVPVPSSGSIASFDIGSGQLLESVTVGTWPTRVRISPNGTRVYVLNQVDQTVSYFTRAESTVDPAIVDRIEGVDRYATGIEISKAGHPDGSDIVYIATGQNYPDALSAAAAAAKDGAPLLLTPQDSLPAAVAAEVERLDPDTIIVVGGLPSVSQAVRDELATYGALHEISGPDRYSTSRSIVFSRFGSGNAARMYLATGQNFPDALSGGAVAGGGGWPVLLTPPTDAADQVTIDLINYLGTTTAVAVGNGISPDYFYTIYARTTANETLRLAGPDRFSTSQLLNAAVVQSAGVVYLATGLAFPDALAGAALAGAQSAPLYVIPPNCVPQRVLNDIARLDPDKVVLLGGEGTLTPAVAAMTPCS